MKTHLSKWVRFAAASLILLAPNAYAEINFNGFASIRATSLDSDTGASPFSQLRGDGDVSFKDESLFAIQATSDLGEGLSATVQLMAEGTNDFDVEARWAYLSYTLNDTHRLSAGRFANPIFYQSQYEKVGYAHNFARLPKAVYIGFNFSVIDGIALDSTFFLGDLTLETKLLYGNWDGTVFISVTGQDETLGLKDLTSLNLALSGDWWTIFAGGFLSELDGGTLDNVYRALAAPGIAAALQAGATQQDVENLDAALISDGKDGIYWFAGFSIDYNNFLVDFEYADYRIDDAADAPNDVWYLALGYRFGNSVITVHTEDYNQDPDYDFLGAVSHPILQATGRGIQDALGQQKFDGYGVTYRYDFHPSAALKVDYFSGEDVRPSVGDYTIWSVGVDLVF